MARRLRVVVAMDGVESDPHEERLRRSDTRRERASERHARTRNKRATRSAHLRRGVASARSEITHAVCPVARKIGAQLLGRALAVRGVLVTAEMRVDALDGFLAKEMRRVVALAKRVGAPTSQRQMLGGRGETTRAQKGAHLVDLTRPPTAPRARAGRVRAAGGGGSAAQRAARDAGRASADRVVTLMNIYLARLPEPLRRLTPTCSRTRG